MAFWHRAHSDECCISLILIPEFNSCFPADGKQIRVWNCHATHGHQRTAIFTSIVCCEFISPSVIKDRVTIRCSLCFSFWKLVSAFRMNEQATILRHIYNVVPWIHGTVYYFSSKRARGSALVNHKIFSWKHGTPDGIYMLLDNRTTCFFQEQ
jgi:hypothetical protein